MEIKRDKYLQMLQIRRHNGFVKVITGIRRSGKSYLLNDIFYDYLKQYSTNKMVILDNYHHKCQLVQVLENPH